MIITTNKFLSDYVKNVESDGVATVSARFEGDKIKTVHAQEVSKLLKENAERRKDPNKGFSDTREFQKIGSIPITIWLQHPEWEHDHKALLKWLSSSEGELFRTVERGI